MMVASYWLMNLRRWRRTHPLRMHMSLVLLLKIIALIIMYHYFFSAAQQVQVDRNSVEQRLLQPMSYTDAQ